MNLAEKMALDCGVKIDEPNIDQLFFFMQNSYFTSWKCDKDLEEAMFKG